MLDMSGVVLGQARAVTRRRFGAPTVTGGRSTPGPYAEATIYATVQPVPGADRRALAEVGIRVDEARVAWIVGTGVLIERGGGVGHDQLIVDGVTYDVTSIRDWRTDAAYQRAILVRAAE